MTDKELHSKTEEAFSLLKEGIAILKSLPQEEEAYTEEQNEYNNRKINEFVALFDGII